MKSLRFVAVLATAIALVVIAFRCAKPLPDTNMDETFLPKVSSIRYIAVGHNNTAAGLFWIMGLTNLGDSYLTGKEYGYLSHVADLSTSLDSLFYTPYYFVGSLTSDDAPDTTDYPVMRRAMRLFPDDWHMAISFALRLSRGPTHDNKGAADVMRPYLNSPDTTIPNHIRMIYRTFELDTMQTELALESALNDVTLPQFKKFRSSFYGKIYRLLGYRGLISDENNKAIHEKIKMVVDDLAEGRATFPQAYTYLIRLKKVEESAPKTQDVPVDTLRMETAEK